MQDPNREPRQKSISELIAEKKEAANLAAQQKLAAALPPQLSADQLDAREYKRDLNLLIFLDKTAPVRELLLSHKSMIDRVLNHFKVPEVLGELARIGDYKVSGGTVVPQVPDYYERLVNPVKEDMDDLPGSFTAFLEPLQPGGSKYKNYWKIWYLPHVPLETMIQAPDVLGGFGYTYISRPTSGPTKEFLIGTGSAPTYGRHIDKGFTIQTGTTPTYRKERLGTEDKFIAKASVIEDEENPWGGYALSVSAGLRRESLRHTELVLSTASTKVLTLEDDPNALRSFLADKILEVPQVEAKDVRERQKEIEERHRAVAEYLKDGDPILRRNLLRERLGLPPL